MLAAGVVALELIGWPATASADLSLRPLGADFQLNAFTTGSQLRPRVAATADRGFVVVWSGGLGELNLVARRLDPGGGFMGSEFPVSSDTTQTSNGSPEIATTGEGGFVVVWRKGLPGPGSAISGRVFDSTGVPLLTDLLVQQDPRPGADPVVAISPAPESALVAWQGPSPGTIDARRYGPSCELGCAPFQVDPGGGSPGSGTPNDPDVATGVTGDFAVVWARAYGGAIDLRWVSSAGAPVGGTLEIDQEADYADDPAIGTAGRRGFLVVWNGEAAGTLASVNARAVDSSGAPLGSQTTLSDSSYPITLYPDVSDGDGAGTFVAVWQNGYSNPAVSFDGSDGSGTSIDGRLMRGSRPVGAPFGVNSHTSGDQGSPSLARNEDGTYLVVWQSDSPVGDDLDRSSVIGRLFRDNSSIFGDDFESGSISFSETFP